jgi:hypothetical protein
MTATAKLLIGGCLAVTGLVIMGIANRQIIAEAECVDCDDEVTTIYKVSEASAEIVEDGE